MTCEYWKIYLIINMMKLHFKIYKNQFIISLNNNNKGDNNKTKINGLV